MPYRPPNTCKIPGCTNPAIPGKSRCQYHYEEWRKTHRFIRSKKPKAPYSKEWDQISAEMLRAYPICKICGKPAEVVHHIIERADGGTDDFANLVTLCRSCHSSYHWYKRFGHKEQRDDLFRKMTAIPRK